MTKISAAEPPTSFLLILSTSDFFVSHFLACITILLCIRFWIVFKNIGFQICNTPNKSYLTLMLIIFNSLPQNLTAKSNACVLSDSFCWSETGWFLAQCFSQVASCISWSYSLLLSFTCGKRTVFKPTLLVICRPQFLDSCWPEQVSLLCHLDFCTGAPQMVAYFSQHDQDGKHNLL